MSYRADDLAPGHPDGGRVAEELIFGKDKITSGATRDISQATKPRPCDGHQVGLFRALGMVEYGENQEEVFLGHSVARNQNVSEDTAKIIDAEVKRLTQGGYEEAKRIMTEKLEDLHTGQGAARVRDPAAATRSSPCSKGIQPRRDEPDDKPPPRPPVVRAPDRARADPEPA